MPRVVVNRMYVTQCPQFTCNWRSGEKDTPTRAWGELFIHLEAKHGSYLLIKDRDVE